MTKKQAPQAARAAAKSSKSVKPAKGATKDPLVEGDKAPAFKLALDNGQRASLSVFAGQKLAIFFYPRADTPGCTREAMDFSRLAAQFAKANTAVLGVSADPVKAQQGFKAKHALKVPLGSDETRDMIRAFGVWGQKSMYGKTFEGILRTTFLIDGRGRVVQVWRNVKVDGHADAVLQAAKALP